MAMGKREQDDQGSFWIPTTALPVSAAHPFYEQVNRILDGQGFDGFVEDLCRKFYADKMGRPSLAPAIYFRLMLIGYLEGIDSERGIAWRVADSLGLRRFLGYLLTDETPDHSTLSRNRRLIDMETHEAVFTWVLKVLAQEGLLKAKTIGIDATTLEANAAMRSIVRRDSGESYQEFLTRLAKESGIETPTREDLVKLDKTRKNKASNDDWQNPNEPDAKITKMKDGRTHAPGPQGRTRGGHGHRRDRGGDAPAGGSRRYEQHPSDARAGGPEHGERRGPSSGRTDQRAGVVGDCGRQGLPQQRGLEGASSSRRADVHRGAGSRSSLLGGQGCGA